MTQTVVQSAKKRLEQQMTNQILQVRIAREPAQNVKKAIFRKTNLGSPFANFKPKKVPPFADMLVGNEKLCVHYVPY